MAALNPLGLLADVRASGHTRISLTTEDFCIRHKLFLAGHQLVELRLQKARDDAMQRLRARTLHLYHS